jgi:hypothetical protein
MGAFVTIEAAQRAKPGFVIEEEQSSNRRRPK